MTGREAGFLLLGCIIGILVTYAWMFIRGFFIWMKRGEPKVIGEIGLDELDGNDGIRFRIERDEDGNAHIVKIKEDEIENGEDSVHRATDIGDDNNGDPT